MATMINCGRDFTFDLFTEDMKVFGEYGRKDAPLREQFVRWLKREAKEFKENWVNKYNKNLFNMHEGYIGDAFKNHLYESEFSDFYKDAYGQRPHLDLWFYVHAVGFPTSEDFARTFCASPVQDAIENAEQTRIEMLN